MEYTSLARLSPMRDHPPSSIIDAITASGVIGLMLQPGTVYSYDSRRFVLGIFVVTSEQYCSHSPSCMMHCCSADNGIKTCDSLPVWNRLEISTVASNTLRETLFNLPRPLLSPDFGSAVISRRRCPPRLETGNCPCACFSIELEQPIDKTEYHHQKNDARQIARHWIQTPDLFE